MRKQIASLVDVSDIFLLGREGEREVRFSIENPRRGVSQEGGVCRKLGGGLIFFSGPKCPPSF